MPSYRKPVRSQYFDGPLYQKMTEDLQLSGKAERTVHGYLRAVRQLADHCRKSPDAIGEAELRRYFLHLKNHRRFAYGSLRVALSGIRFFYQTTCPRDWNVLAMLKLKNVNTLPEVITRQQVRQIILAATTQRMRVFFWTVYSMGLRLNEALHLQVGDVDSPRRLVHVHRGKGAKDRYVPISQFSVHHFLVTFTVPRELRSLLRAHQRAAYEALFQASAEALRQVAAATRSLKDAQLGFFGVLHTWGRDPMVYHPHVHYLVPGGGAVLDSQGKPIAWKSTPMNFLVHHGTLIRLYKAKLADALRAAGLYERVPCDVWTKNFVVDIQPVDDGRSTTPAGKNCG